MKSKNFIRLVVVAGLLAWPGVESYRLWVAKQQVAESARQQRAVSERYAYLQKIQVPSPSQGAPATVPVSNPSPQ